jgi:hypothetical protein
MIHAVTNINACTNLSHAHAAWPSGASVGRIRRWAGRESRPGAFVAAFWQIGARALGRQEKVR